MENGNDQLFLKNDLDSDIIRPRTASGSLRTSFDLHHLLDDVNGLSMSLDFENTYLDDKTSKSSSWEEAKGVWPLEISTSQPNEILVHELTKNLISEKRKRKALEELLVQKGIEIKRLVEEKTVFNNSDLSEGNISESKGDESEMDWMKAKTKLEQKLKLLQQDIQEKDLIISDLRNENKVASLIRWRTTNEKLKQDVEIEVWRRKYLELQQQQLERDELIKKKDEDIQFLRSELEIKNDENYKMALKLLDYKSKVSSVELQLRKWPVKKIHKLYSNVDVEIVLTKNPSNGVLSIDVLDRGKHNPRPLKAVEGVPGF